MIAPASDHDRGNERCGAGADVHHRSAGEVERAELGSQPSVAHTQCASEVMRRASSTRTRRSVHVKPHAFDHRAGRDERHRDAGKQRLEDGEGEMRNGRCRPAAAPTCDSPNQPQSPNTVPGPNASEYPNSVHCTVTTPSAATLIMIVERGARSHKPAVEERESVPSAAPGPTRRTPTRCRLPRSSMELRGS